MRERERGKYWVNNGQKCDHIEEGTAAAADLSSNMMEVFAYLSPGNNLPPN